MTVNSFLLRLFSVLSSSNNCDSDDLIRNVMVPWVMFMNYWYILQTQKFLWGTNFHRQGTRMTIKSTKICTDKKFATGNYVVHVLALPTMALRKYLRLLPMHTERLLILNII